MNLHPYDGVERRFRHDDGSDRATALEVIARILGVSPEAPLYDLSFYSGGIGVFDSLHVSIQATHVPLLDELRPWAEAVKEEEILWLISADEETPADVALRQFIDGKKAAFQPAYAGGAVFFGRESGVNAWQLVYLQDGGLHYLAFDQG